MGQPWSVNAQPLTFSLLTLTYVRMLPPHLPGDATQFGSPAAKAVQLHVCHHVTVIDSLPLVISFNSGHSALHPDSLEMTFERGNQWLKGDLSFLSFLSFSFPVLQCVVQVLVHVSNGLKGTEAHFSYRKHCSWNASSVVPPFILWPCDITSHHHVSHLHDL